MAGVRRGRAMLDAAAQRWPELVSGARAGALAELLERTTQLQHAKILESMMNETSADALAPTSMLAHDLRKRARELP